MSFGKEKNHARSSIYRSVQGNTGLVLTFLLIFLAVILVRQIWLFSVIERDEGGIALVALQWINGLPPYVHSFNNAGPLAYVIYSIPTLLFGTDFIPIRMINNIIFFLSIIPFYLCTKDWFNKKVALVSSFSYGIFMSAPIYEGQLALTSSLSAPIVIFSVFFCSRYVLKTSRKALATSAFLLSVATLIKVLVAPGFFLLLGAVALRYLRGDQKNHHVKELLRDLSIAVLGFSVIPIIFVLYFAWMGALGNLITVFVDLSLVGHQSLPDVPGGISLYVITQGLPLWIFAVLGLAVSFLRRPKFSLILASWSIFAAVIAAFPPHFGHRYVYLIAPASIFAGVGVAAIFSNFKRGLKKRPGERFFVSSFFIALLMLSLPIAITFQMEQYPQYQIDSKFLNFKWLYADSASYSTQTKLADFLRSNCPPESPILVHGWSSEIYYLANKLPPSKYVWSRTAPRTLTIPEDEYNKFVTSVKNQEYEFVVFFDDDLKALENRREDPVVNETLSKYFYSGNIDNALIFSKYNSEGQFLYYSFIENFPLASKVYWTDNATIRNTEEDFKNDPILIPAISSLSIQGDSRYTIFQHPLSAGESGIAYEVALPEKSALSFGIGIDPSVWEKMADGVNYMIRIGDGNSTRTVWSYHIDPKNVPVDRKWQDFEVDLSAYGTRKITVFFVTAPAPSNNNAYEWAHWANPVILASKGHG